MKVQAIRRALGFKQSELAAFLSVAYATVNRWENGHSEPAGLERIVLEAVERALSLNPDLGDHIREWMLGAGKIETLWNVLEWAVRGSALRARQSVSAQSAKLRRRPAPVPKDKPPRPPRHAAE